MEPARKDQCKFLVLHNTEDSQEEESIEVYMNILEKTLLILFVLFVLMLMIKILMIILFIKIK